MATAVCHLIQIREGSDAVRRTGMCAQREGSRPTCVTHRHVKFIFHEGEGDSNDKLRILIPKVDVLHLF